VAAAMDFERSGPRVVPTGPERVARDRSSTYARTCEIHSPTRTIS
jgi:hypothetical protein